MVEAGLKVGATIKCSGGIQAAVKLGRIDTLALLLKFSANVNERLPASVGFIIRDERFQQASERPLQIAMLDDQPEVAEWLSAHAGDASMEDQQERTPAMVAQEL